MNPTEVMTAGRDMMMFALMLVSPFLLAAMVASLVIGLLQAATRINDLTLGFVPRFLAVMLVLYLGASWAGGRMIGYIERAATSATLLH
jgi:flagellar biosynthetic protein FliQ